MRNVVTAKVEHFVGALRTMAEEIEPHLRYVSQEAGNEWQSIRRTWPSDLELGAGTTRLTERQLEAMFAKVRRFRDIVMALGPKCSEPIPTRPPLGDAEVEEGGGAGAVKAKAENGFGRVDAGGAPSRGFPIEERLRTPRRVLRSRNVSANVKDGAPL